MKTLIAILSLLVAAPVLAEEGQVCRTKTTTVVSCSDTCVCPPAPAPKPKPKKRKPAKKPVVVKPAPKPTPPAPAPAPAPKKDPSFVIGPRLALGLGVREPNVSGLVGLRAHYRPAHLGLEAYYLFDYGVGAQLLVYPYQGEKLDVHVNAGALFPGSYLSVNDVPRTWDLTVGAGLEYQVVRHVSLTLDWRWATPSPVFMAEHDDPLFDPAGRQVYGNAGRYLDVGAVMGNSFTQSQVLLGVMIRN
jgi:hypothetical protein